MLKLFKQPTNKLPPAGMKFLAETIGEGDVYLKVLNHPWPMLSVFDDLKYDRSDIDNLSPGMYRYVRKRLAELGFKQKTGRIFEHQQFDIRGVIPKARVQGSSPFHAIRYNPIRKQDFYIFTPTQVAAVLITELPHQESVPLLIELAEQHPFNLFKLKDYLDQTVNHQQFIAAIPHLKYKQREAISKLPLRQLRAL